VLNIFFISMFALKILLINIKVLLFQLMSQISTSIQEAMK